MALAISACGSSSTAVAPPTTVGPPAILRVPAQFPTIQAAVSHAHAGDLVLVSPGVYHESVTITAPDVDLRGLDRNTVILDGGDTMANGVTANGNGDVVENLTVRHYAVNGVLFTKATSVAYAGSSTKQQPGGTILRGYRASYVTAYDNGLYGIYAFASQDGQLDHTYTSGQPDSGIYIGQCDPCNATVTASVGAANRVGFEAANGSGNLNVIDSDWSGDRAGIAIESSTEELLAPQHAALVAGNLVSDNDNPKTPTQDEDTDVFGYGIVIGGGVDDVVMANRVTGNPTVGILISDLDGYLPAGDQVTGNVATGNGTDLAMTLGGGGPLKVAGTCFVGNTSASSLPDHIETALPCAGGPGTITVGPLVEPTPPAGVDYASLPPPPAQMSMPGAATAPASAATGLGGAPAASTITVPAG